MPENPRYRTQFRVERDLIPKVTFDMVGDKPILNGEYVTIHWPEQEERRLVFLNVSVDRHGTEHRRAYFLISRWGAELHVFLRDIQHQISVCP